MAIREAREGILVADTINSTGAVDKTKVYGSDAEVITFSRNEVESLDLISEGVIDGLVSGRYISTGVLGETGWRSSIFSGFRTTDNNINPSGYLRSIYWNETPVLDDRGQFNFQSVDVTWTEGLPNGTVLQTVSPYQKSSRSIGERLRHGFPKTYRILNKDVRGAVVNVRIPGLYITDKETGNIQRTFINYTLSYRPLFSNKEGGDYMGNVVEEVFGKLAQNAYVRSTRVDFSTSVWTDKNHIGWEVKIERTTPESTTSFLVNSCYVDSITEIQGNVYTYPNSAMVRGLFSAEYFSSVPERAFEVRGIKVKIPGNYNPIRRSYSGEGYATTNGAWNGLFASGKQWTNNPAWCYYDLITNQRYGLGKYISEDYVDKFSLYDIGQYCDVLVSDGYGGLEPRMTCNLSINSREDAYKVVDDMASIFRGITYYANGLIYAVQDSPKDPRIMFNNSNVENGDFSYSSTSKKNRHSVAIVRYNDPNNFYKPAVEYVEDVDSIRKYGIREVELAAFGTTSRGQAIRLGRFILLSENLETETVSFVGGLEAATLRPGDTLKIFDINKKLKKHGGRIYEMTQIGTPATGTLVVLDRLVPTMETNFGYTLSLLTPSYTLDTAQTTGLTSADVSNFRRNFIQKINFSGFQSTGSGNYTVLNLYNAFDTTGYSISGRPIWSIELMDAYSSYTGSRYFTTSSYDYYRAINIRESDVHKYEVVGLQYYPGKYFEIESGLSLHRTNLVQNKIPDTPYNLQLDTYKDLNNNYLVKYSFLVNDVSNINSFRAYANIGAFPDNSVPSVDKQIATLPSTVTTENFYPTETGNYYFRVYSSNDVDGILSASFAQNNTLITDINPIQNIIISSLELNSFSGTYSGAVATNNLTIITSNDADPLFTWQVGANGINTIEEDLRYRITIRENDLTYSRIPSNVILYETTGIEVTNYTFSADTNIAIASGPYREYQIVVEAHNLEGQTSAGNMVGSTDANWNSYPYGYDILSLSNPRQTGIELSNNLETLKEDLGGYSFTLVTGANYSQFGFSGRSELFVKFEGTGLFSGSGVFTGNYITRNFYVTGSGYSYITSFTGFTYTGFGTFYSGSKLLGTSTIISGTNRYSGTAYYFDTGIYEGRRTGEYKSVSHINGDGGISIQFTSGVFDEDLVGAFVYTSTGRFSKLESSQQSSSNHWGRMVQKTECTFNPTDGFISHDFGAYNYRGAPFLYCSVSFFDRFDKAMLDRGVNIGTGLYMSNNSKVFNDPAVGTLSIAGIGTFMAVRINKTIDSVDPSTLNTNVDVIAAIGSNSWALGSSTLNGITTVYYITNPLVNSPYQGTPGGTSPDTGGGTSGGSVGGAGGDDDGCLSENSYILTPNGYIKITELKEGDEVVSLDFGNYSTDVYKWKQENINPDHYKFVTSVIKEVIRNSYNHYFIINKKLEITTEHPCLTKRNNVWKYIQVKDLVLGDILWTEDGNGEEIFSITKINESLKTWNIVCEPYHSYFCEGLYLHNPGPGQKP